MATRPAWVNSELFPFHSHFAEVDGAQVHYIDEGDGPVFLGLHGNPTWSFLYRHIVAGLSDRFRCLAPDYPGFGLSTAPRGYRYTIAEHARVVEAFIEQLDLRDITMMVQDWGGPIGMWSATRHPERFVPSSSATPGPGRSRATRLPSVSPNSWAASGPGASW